METRSATVTEPPSAPVGAEAVKTRRRRLATEGDEVRYFLPKPGSSPDKPELGREMPSEGEALIEAFKSSQPFYALTVCKALAEVNGGGNPVIVRQVVARS